MAKYNRNTGKTLVAGRSSRASHARERGYSYTGDRPETWQNPGGYLHKGFQRGHQS